MTRRRSTTVAMRDGVHHYAFVVDGTGCVAEPAAPHLRAADGRVLSFPHVAGATDLNRRSRT